MILPQEEAIVLAPGHFGHTEAAHASVHFRLLASGIQQLQKELGETKSPPAGFFCLTVAPSAPNQPAPEIPDLIRRIVALLAGGDVLLFRRPELYHMTALVNRHTQEPVRFVGGLSLVIRAFEDIYANHQGSKLSGGPRTSLRRKRSHQGLPLSNGGRRSAGIAEECLR